MLLIIGMKDTYTVAQAQAHLEYAETRDLVYENFLRVLEYRSSR
jgi:hypothetical protein